MANGKSGWDDVGELGTHQGYISNPIKCGKTTDLKIGCVATFMYLDEPRFAFILNPSYRYQNQTKWKMHAATLKYIDRESVLKYLIPNLSAAQDPYSFYYANYKPTLTSNDAYRTYLVDKVESLTMFDYDPGNATNVHESGATNVDELQEFYVKHYGRFAEQYRQQDKGVMYELFKRGASLKDVENYYKAVVLKRYVAQYSDAEVMKRFFEEI